MNRATRWLLLLALGGCVALGLDSPTKRESPLTLLLKPAESVKVEGGVLRFSYGVRNEGSEPLWVYRYPGLGFSLFSPEFADKDGRMSGEGMASGSGGVRHGRRGLVRDPDNPNQFLCKSLPIPPETYRGDYLRFAPGEEHWKEAEYLIPAHVPDGIYTITISLKSFQNGSEAEIVAWRGEVEKEFFLRVDS